MADPWELLGRTADIISVGGPVYLVYRNRDTLKRIATKTAVKLGIKNPTPVEVHMQPAVLQARGVELSGVITGGSSMHAELQVERPPAWEELLWWYLRNRWS